MILHYFSLFGLLKIVFYKLRYASVSDKTCECLWKTDYTFGLEAAKCTTAVPVMYLLYHGKSKGRNHIENFDEKDQQALGDLKSTAPLLCSDLLVATSLGKR